MKNNQLPLSLVKLKKTNISSSFSVRVDHSQPQVIICYHANCMDGLLSAGLAREVFSPNVLYVLPVNYGTKLPFNPRIHRNLHVVFVDFCPDEETLHDLLNNHQDSIAKVSIFDHHVGQVEKLEELVKQTRRVFTNTILEVHYKNDRSATGIMHDVFDKLFNAKRSTFSCVSCEPPLSNAMYRLAENYDLWKHKGEKDCNETYMASYFTFSQKTMRSLVKEAEATGEYHDRLDAITNVFDVHHGLFKGDEESIIEKGKGLAQEEYVKHEAIVKTAEIFEVGQYNLHWIACDGQSVNGVSAIVGREFPDSVITACYETKGEMLKVSFRPGRYSMFQLHLVANFMDSSGGGHKDSAGVNLKANVHEALSKLRQILTHNADDVLTPTVI